MSARISKRRLLSWLCWLLVLGTGYSPWPAAGAEVTAEEMSRARQFVESSFALETQDQRPFSFVYNGRSSAELLPRWQPRLRLEKQTDQCFERALAFADPQTQLAVRCVVTVYRDFPAVEWTLYFKNEGSKTTPILEQVQPMDGSVPLEAGVTPKLYYAEGSHALITDFQPLERDLANNERLSLASFGGRPSDGFLPFFNLAQSDHNGVVLAIGWTGQWAAEFSRNGAGPVRMRAGMERTHLVLHPGEEIRTPAILLMFWSGDDRMSGQNLFRKLLLRHYTPKPGGAPIDPPVAYSPHAEIPFEGTTETNMLQVIGRISAHHLPVDYWWIDAGWYDCDKNWARWVGNWRPSSERYPNGLKPVADAAHQAGLKFLLWFEPERVMPGTWLYQNHADWLLPPPPATNLPPELRYMANDGFHLLNLGNPDALSWVERTFSGMISKVGIDAYRNDFNMYPVYYWRNGESPDRQGINEIRYVLGLYAYFDSLVRDHPRLLLDTCASGGRRIDFEMLRRCLVLTRSDYLWDPVGQQCHTYGLAQWIPLTGIGAASANPYNCRSGMGSHYVETINTQAASQQDWETVRQFLRQYLSIRPLFQGDFYPLSPYSTAQKDWLAFQFDRSDLGEGVVQIFRRTECPEETWTVRLRGLDPNACYLLANWDEDQPQTKTGRELMDQGLTVHLKSKPAAGVVVYRKQ
ncbi:MAG: alpha-galactosidase [Candidatus Omnitrophica bacterium]|nr:alpha-galactosidase [Candidatus Omnitrophota bacterium]